MKIGDEVFVHGYIDEIRKYTVIIRNNGGYFGTIPSEVITGELPSAQPAEIIYCKDCAKHNMLHGHYNNGTYIGIEDCCPLTEIRGRAQGHEFDYQYCAYAERRTDGKD